MTAETQPPQAVAVFPTRPLTVRPPGGGGGWRALLGLAFVVLLAAGALAWWAPGIVRDYAMRAGARPVVGGQVTDGRCQIRLAVLALCDATLRARGKNGPVEDSLHLAFVDWPGARHSATVMQSTARPDRLTSDLGLERLTNRVLTLGGWVLLWLVILATLVLAFLRERARRRALIAAARTGVAPMPVRLLKVTAGGGARIWHIGYDQGGPRTANWRVGRKDEPFLISPDGWMLALRGPPGTPPMPLDDRLEWADLTADERSRVLSARDAQWAHHPPG